MMPITMGRKTRRLEIVENLCRTATLQQIMPSPLRVGSRLRNSARAGHDANAARRNARTQSASKHAAVLFEHRLAVAIEQPVRQRAPAGNGDHISAEPVAVPPFGGQPSAGSQALPDINAAFRHGIL